MMLYPYSSSIVLRTLRSQSLHQSPTARFSTTARRAEDVLIKKTQKTSTQLPYFIHRSENKNLPVYEEMRKSNRKQTRIRKVDGDSNALQRDVIKVLGIDKQNVVVNGLTKHVIIKGWYKKDIVKWLEELRF